MGLTPKEARAGRLEDLTLLASEVPTFVPHDARPSGISQPVVELAPTEKVRPPYTPCGHAGDDSSPAVSTIYKYGEKTIDLAVEGWVFVASKEMGASLKEFGGMFTYQKDGIEHCISETAYSKTPWQVALPLGIKSFYQRGNGINPLLPPEVLAEAKQYLSLSTEKQKEFLEQVYLQATGENGGHYAQLLAKKITTSPILLNYFADKMEGHGMQKEALGVVNAVLKNIPQARDALLQTAKAVPGASDVLWYGPIAQRYAPAPVNP
ncbi:hypothetical protein HZB01_02045 [Candidatus Woesearchaeota archaeon]|nr:hypothetical protein [Candidatus Woesearchaeota archaeon]